MVKQQTAERDALARAQNDLQIIERSLQDAKNAQLKTLENGRIADANLRSLKEQAAEAPPDNKALIDALARGDSDAATINRPQEILRERIASAERECATWSAAWETIDAAIREREAMLKTARERVEKAARAALGEMLNLSERIAEAQELQDRLVEKRLALMAVWDLVDPPRREQISAFFGNPFLSGEMHEAWKRDPACAIFRATFEKLKTDADASLSD